MQLSEASSRWLQPPVPGTSLYSEQPARPDTGVLAACLHPLPDLITLQTLTLTKVLPVFSHGWQPSPQGIHPHSLQRSMASPLNWEKRFYPMSRVENEKTQEFCLLIPEAQNISSTGGSCA